MNNLHIFDIVVIGMYLALCLVIGLYKANKIKTIREYTLGTGHISTAVLSFTIFATYVGAEPTIGLVEKVHSMGLIFAAGIIATPLFWLITAKIYAKNIAIFKKAGCISASDIMGLLYGIPGKWVTNIFSIFFAIGIIGAQIGAIGYLFNYFLGTSHAVGVLLGFGVLVIYSLFGGIRAVALTDTFQGLILLVAIPVACAIAFHEIGGYDGLVKNLPATHLSIDLTYDNMLLLSSMVFYSILPVSAGTFIQRFLMANDSAQLNNALRIIAYTTLPFTMVICLIGFIIKVKAPEIDSNIAFFYLIGNYLPIGVTGLLISGILAAIMSTADSWLNTTSVLCAHDIAKALFPKLTDRQELLIARIAVLLISGSATSIALTGTSLMALSWLACNFWLPVIFVPLVAGFLNFQSNHKSFIASTILGATGALLGRHMTGEFATISLLLGVTASAIGLFGFHYCQTLSIKQIIARIFSGNVYNITNQGANTSIVSRSTHAIRYNDYCYLFGALGMIYFLGSSFFMAFTDMKILYTIVYLKAAAAILCFGLCSYDSHLTTAQQEKYIPIYWYATLLYCFPFLSSYIALIYDGSLPWMINFMLSSILLYVFGGWFAAVSLSIVGFALAYLLFKYTGYSLAMLTAEQPKMLGYIYCVLTAAIVLILKQRDMIKERELQSRLLYGAAVAHEVINPLQGSAMMADVLIDAFGDKERPDQISLEDFEGIRDLLKPFKETSATALKTIDRMLNLVRTDISAAEDMGTYDINDCVENALSVYGLSNYERNRIKVNSEKSFRFKGSKNFVCHVINNLISNALKYAGPDSIIEIWYEDRELHFKDNGRGISPDKLPYLFQPFERNGETSGTGVGLPFCKQIMDGIGGSIDCRSVPNKGTEFVLTFILV